MTKKTSLFTKKELKELEKLSPSERTKKIKSKKKEILEKLDEEEKELEEESLKQIEVQKNQLDQILEEELKRSNDKSHSSIEIFKENLEKKLPSQIIEDNIHITQVEYQFPASIIYAVNKSTQNKNIPNLNQIYLPNITQTNPFYENNPKREDIRFESLHDSLFEDITRSSLDKLANKLDSKYK